MRNVGILFIILALSITTYAYAQFDSGLFETALFDGAASTTTTSALPAVTNNIVQDIVQDIVKDIVTDVIPEIIE